MLCTLPAHRLLGAHRPLIQQRALPLPLGARRPLCRRGNVRVAASQDDDKPGEKDDLGTAFKEELRRRGLEAQRAAEYLEAQQAKPQNPFEASSSSNGAPRPRAPPPPMAEMPGSRSGPAAGGLSGQAGEAFNGPNGANEGLGGLIPRGLRLLQLGFSIFLGFLPYMLGFSVLFTSIWLVFGDAFFHYGDTRVLSTGGVEKYVPSRPTYLDPEQLLSEETVDPYVPLR